MSSRPKRWAVCCTNAMASDSRPMCASTKCAAPPPAWISPATRLPRSTSRSANTTRAPSATNRRTVASPMPDAPPEIAAIFPLSRDMRASPWLVSLAREQRVLRIQRRRPSQTDVREVVGEQVLAVRSHAALDPGHEVVERLPPGAAIDGAVPGAAHRALDQQVIGPRGQGAAPVRLLEAQRHPGITGLVQPEQRCREPPRRLRVHRIGRRRARVLHRLDPPDTRVELFFTEPQTGIDAVA